MKPPAPASRPRTGLRAAVAQRLKLRHVFFLFFLGSGILPLLLSSVRMIGLNREILKTQEKVLLTNSAQQRAKGLSEDLARTKERLREIGWGLLADPDFDSVEGRLRQPWVRDYLSRFVLEFPEILALRVVDQQGNGLRFGEPLAERVTAELGAAFEEARRGDQTVYRFIILPPDQKPGVAVAVPVGEAASGRVVILQALLDVPLDAAAPGPLERGGGTEDEELFLIDAKGALLWSAGSRPDVEVALLASPLVEEFVRVPFPVTGEYELEVGGRKVPILARVVPVEETGWAVVAHKPTAVAFAAVEAMARNTIYSSILLVPLALVLAVVASRWLSRPIQRLAEASHEIAAGNFDRRVVTAGLGLEIADLAGDFNRMSDYVENYIAQLKRAAETNRELFISVIRAFAAAIDAKDPYTRGHSERVASYSRAISRYLGLPKHLQERVWVSAVLHDIGKIGVEDHILKKGGVLTAEEFEQMKLHPQIGADILEPISALKEMLPGIRWHHEAWNGSGYPDRLRGEQIPLMARIIAVGDTFDAITTNRPYQSAYTPDYALETIKKLAGAKFDAKIVTAFLLAWEAGHIVLDRGRAPRATVAAAPAAAVS